MSVPSELQRLREENQLLKQEIQILKKQNKELIRRVEQLEKKLIQYENPHTPSSKKRKNNTKRDPNKPRFPGKPKGSKGGGINLPEPDEVKEHKFSEEEMQERGLKEIGLRRKRVIEFVENPFRIIEHIVYVYEDQDGNEILPDERIPEGFYGPRFQAFIGTLRAITGISHEKISELVKQLRPDLNFSAAGSLGLLDTLASNLDSERREIHEHILSGNYLHADETGLRFDGRNGFVWIAASLDAAVYMTNLSRSQEAAEELLGDYDKTIVSDGYVVYKKYKKQRCWAHLIREVGDQTTEETADRFLKYYHMAKEAKEKGPPDREKFVKKMKECHLRFFINGLRSKGHNKLAKTIENALPDLFRGVITPEIPLTNNLGERGLRKVVVMRKLMGCIRNDKGERFIENLLSCTETWRLQGKNLFQELQKYAS